MKPRERSYQTEFDSYVFSKQPGFVEPEMRKAFKQAVPLRTVVVYCYDPRAVNIPEAVAKAIPEEVYPGEILRTGVAGRSLPPPRFSRLWWPAGAPWMRSVP